MIIPLGGFLLGALLGAWRARAAGGNGRDMAQWAFGMGTALALVGLFVLIFISRAAV
ncbi:hypothetical protein [Salipiger sp. IMCC34102]|uniref:hypothetical protein n=1 Tax=Salipiger sp. IMCC34102 TaxID=2510647 RepID=UPI0013EDD631|nr:hypothetical protein [Salipiger sp. IMCC34102]